MNRFVIVFFSSSFIIVWRIVADVYILICILIAFLWKSNTVSYHGGGGDKNDDNNNRNGVICMATYEFTLERTKHRRQSIRRTYPPVCIRTPCNEWNIPSLYGLQIEAIFHLSDKRQKQTHNKASLLFLRSLCPFRFVLLCLKRIMKINEINVVDVLLRTLRRIQQYELNLCVSRCETEPFYLRAFLHQHCVIC